MPITTLSRGDVVLLDLPFSDLTGFKRRPALVISNEKYLGSTLDLIICAVTSNLKAVRFPGSTQVLEWQEAGLLRPSVITAQIFTLDQGLVLRRLGRLTAEDLNRADQNLQAILF